jgi:hypothetical protein
MAFVPVARASGRISLLKKFGPLISLVMYFRSGPYHVSSIRVVAAARSSARTQLSLKLRLEVC